MTRPGKLTFAIDGLGCIDCVSALENAVMPLRGVDYVGVCLSSRTMTVRPGPDIDLSDIAQRVTALGYGFDTGKREGSPVTSCRCHVPPHH